MRPNLATEPTQPPTEPANAKTGAARAESNKPEQKEHVQVPKEAAAVPGTDDVESPMEVQPEPMDGIAADGQLEGRTADQGIAGNEAALPENAGLYSSLKRSVLCNTSSIEVGTVPVPFSSKLNICNVEQESQWRLMGEQR